MQCELNVVIPGQWNKSYLFLVYLPRAHAERQQILSRVAGLESQMSRLQELVTHLLAAIEKPKPRTAKLDLQVDADPPLDPLETVEDAAVFLQSEENKKRAARQVVHAVEELPRPTTRAIIKTILTTIIRPGALKGKVLGLPS